MTYFADLAPCTYFGSQAGDALRAIGWLERGHEYTKGPVPAEFFVALAQLVANPCAVTAGHHACDLCRFSGGPHEVIVGKLRVPMGMSDVVVPADECVYIAPATIVHYIDAHEYQPPEAFQRAVIACPEPRSTRFRYLLMKHKLGWLAPPSPRKE